MCGLSSGASPWFWGLFITQIASCLLAAFQSDLVRLAMMLLLNVCAELQTLCSLSLDDSAE